MTPMKFLTVKSLPMFIGLTRSSQTTKSCTNMVFPILNLAVITPWVFISFSDAFLSFGVSPAFIDSFSFSLVSNKALISLS